MDITGKIKLINDTKEYGSNGFRKRELVVTTEEQYPQDLLVEFIQDNYDILNSYKVGESVKVDILSLIHISEPTRLLSISYAVFCLQKKTH